MRDFHPEDDVVFPKGYVPEVTPDDYNPGIPNQLLDFILRSESTEVVNTDLFAVMKKRRSTRKFSDKPVETIKIDKRKIIPSVTHINGTGRVQTVSRSTNDEFYSLINSFFKISNVPILLNTSFNENEPIVMKPIDAINCFLRTEMDLLVLNNYIIKR